MTHTPQLIKRKRQIIHQLCEIAKQRGWRRDTTLRAFYNDLEWQLAKIEYAIMRRHYRHNPDQWRDTDG